MYIVHVSMKVKEDAVNNFIEVVEDNRKHSIQEEGIVQFDVFQEKEEPSRFLIIEVYKTPEDQAKHRETEHFTRFKERVPELLEEPYTITTYNNVFA